MDMLSESLQQLKSFQKIHKINFFLFPHFIHIHCLSDNFHFQCQFADWMLAFMDSLWVIGNFTFVERFGTLMKLELKLNFLFDGADFCHYYKWIAGVYDFEMEF